jgi:hypothetical protein
VLVDALWPLDGPYDPAVALPLAAAELHDDLDAAGLVPLGPAVYDLTEHHLAARVHASRQHAGGDPRPWESREAMADELLDWRAA